ncbi:hypothetical protein Glove_276g15 [Diversispora epigaea]|uniref:Tc1-like transposase DDE domain-containing protein n=1 Tax=Diversispora epigaea TaxID=1348612 RepID=A0A397I453_9GLOM|nr:hypothetical protein Glove_276g15 [Diversispora epigaea]
MKPKKYIDKDTLIQELLYGKQHNVTIIISFAIVMKNQHELSRQLQEKFNESTGKEVEMMIWWLPKENHDINYLDPTVKNGGGGVMMWGVFLEFEEENREYLFQQDSTPIHTSAKTQNFIQVKIPLLPWPEQSPDLNLIGHLWDELEHCIRAKKEMQEFEMFLQECWSQIKK